MLNKGIILAGGHGTRLYPLTLGASKQLLPVYDKPMIYYPLSVLMNSGIRNILIISTIDDISKFKCLLGDGNKLGLKIRYEVQNQPNGIAESFIIGSDFIGKDNVCLILGDNIFYGSKLHSFINQAKFNLTKGLSTIFGVSVNNPQDFGVVSFNSDNKIEKIVEKPINPTTDIIVAGLYFYTNDVIEIANGLIPSKRGELEITELNNIYLSRNKLSLLKLDKEIKWIDTGTYNSLLKASRFFQDKEKSTQKKFACIEEISLKMGYIKKEQLEVIARSMKNSEYGEYLFRLINK